MTIAPNSIVRWEPRAGVTRVGRVLGIHQSTAIIRGTDGVTRCVFADQVEAVRVPPAVLHQLGVAS